ncbi:MAG: hypothetical protein KAJ19_12015 [Gammaproteobacteria bacterium]|nr:hypothetical protein [Gammaproteobacteria bacterium]
MTHPFDRDLEAVFEDRAQGFSEDLRARLRELWEQGVLEGRELERIYPALETKEGWYDAARGALVIPLQGWAPNRELFDDSPRSSSKWDGLPVDDQAALWLEAQKLPTLSNSIHPLSWEAVLKDLDEAIIMKLADQSRSTPPLSLVLPPFLRPSQDETKELFAPRPSPLSHTPLLGSFSYGSSWPKEYTNPWVQKQGLSSGISQTPSKKDPSKP